MSFGGQGETRSWKRRRFLGTAVGAAAGLALSGCTSGRMFGGGGGRSPVHLFPVRVSWDRVIRTTVGLRPFREAGFRLEVESLDEKTVIHNYGHGGSGMSLSWGTGYLAAELATEHDQRRVGVIGCGIVGLTTARQLQRRGFDVTIHAASLPPATTSNMSWAGFTPTSGLVDSSARTPTWDAQFRRAVEISFREHQLLVGRGYGVTWIDTFSATDTAGGGGGAVNPLMPAGLQPGGEVLERGEHPFSTRYAIRRPTMRYEPSIYLEALMRDVIAFGGRIEVRRFDSIRDLMELEEPLLVNCTGLGSRRLFSDSSMTPVKGQLTFLVPQPEVTYAMGGMMPRSDGIVLGHVNQRGVESLDIDEEEQRRVVENAMRTFGALPDPPAGTVPSRLADSLPPPPVESFFDLTS